MKATIFLHPSFQNLTEVVPNLHDSHFHQYKVVRWIVVHEK
jgi:hypothetical protein